MRILGIETSCDDTAAAIYDGDAGLIAHRLATQIAIHEPFGGVVPELAARDHIKTLLPLIDHLIKGPENRGTIPDAIAYTAGPGLAGALLVGASVAAGLSSAWGVPALGIHHMEGHLLAPFLEPDPPPRRCSRCWCPAGIPCWSMSRPWARIASSANRWTTRPARRSTRPRSCSA